MVREFFPKTRKINRPVAARDMVVGCTPVVVEVDVTETPGFKELAEVPVELGMAAIERAAEATSGKFGQEYRSPEMAAFPSSHVFHTDPDPVLLLETGKVIKRALQGRKGAVPHLIIRRVTRVYHEVVCADSVADREYIT